MDIQDHESLGEYHRRRAGEFMKGFREKSIDEKTARFCIRFHLEQAITRERDILTVLEAIDISVLH